VDQTHRRLLPPCFQFLLDPARSCSHVLFLSGPLSWSCFPCLEYLVFVMHLQPMPASS
jgi:hypothetical protein